MLGPGGLRGGVPVASENTRRWETGCECHMRCPEADRTMASALVGKASEKGQVAGSSIPGKQ